MVFLTSIIIIIINWSGRRDPFLNNVGIECQQSVVVVVGLSFVWICLARSLEDNIINIVDNNNSNKLFSSFQHSLWLVVYSVQRGCSLVQRVLIEGRDREQSLCQ